MEWQLLTRSRAVTVLGLLVGALGIAILWASGVEFPIYPPAGIVILLAGAAFVALAPWRWAAGVGAFLGLFVLVGFLIGPTGLPNLFGEEGTVSPPAKGSSWWGAHRPGRGRDRHARQLPQAGSGLPRARQGRSWCRRGSDSRRSSP
jgi:hypothetical protein